jgi:hypothetical protein
MVPNQRFPAGSVLPSFILFNFIFGSIGIDFKTFFDFKF